MSREMLWRTLIRVTGVNREYFNVVLPGWNPDLPFGLFYVDIPDFLLPHIAVGARFHAKVNIGEGDLKKLRLEQWEAE